MSGEEKKNRPEVYLHQLVNLSTVQHQEEILEIIQGSLPGHVFCLHRQVARCPESKRGGDHLCSAEENKLDTSQSHCGEERVAR